MKYPEETVGEVVKDYVSGMATKVVASKYKMHIATVRRLVRQKGQHVRNNRECRQTYKIDETFFNRIDSHVKAQILGFIYADGCVHQRGADSRRLQIILKADDTDYLERIRQEMKNELPLKVESHQDKRGKTRHIVRFVSSNARLIDAIEKLGVVPRKSLTIGFPDETMVSKEFIGSFVLGVFEGDGCIHVPPNKSRKHRCADVSIAATINFNEKLKSILESHGISCYLSYPKKMAGKNFCSLRINTVASVMKFYDFIYGCATFRMNRKHERFIEFKARYDENLKHKFNFKHNSVKGHVVSPSGEYYYFNTLSDFARDMGLNVLSFHGFISRRGAYKKRNTQNGWRIPTESEIAAARAAGTLIEKIYRQPPISSEQAPLPV